MESTGSQPTLLEPQLTQAEAFARIRLLRSPNIGPISYRQLIARFGTARAALDALPDLGKRGRGVYHPASAQSIEREVVAVRQAGARYLFHDQPDYPALLAELAAFKRFWLARTGIIAPLFDEGAPLLPALAQVLHEAGMLRVFVLEKDGRAIAISMNFIEGRSLRAFVTAYDPTFHQGSPGMVLMMDYIRWAFDHGLDEVDFLTGDEDFKNRFANEAVPLASIAGAGSPLGHVAMLADEVGNRARKRLRLWRARRTDAPAATPAE